MRILFVGLTLPFPPTSGQRLRNLAILRALLADGHEVTWVSFYEPGQGSTGLEEAHSVCKNIVLIPLPGCQTAGLLDAAARLRSLFSSEPHGARRFRSTQMREAVARCLNTEQFDALICDDVYLAGNLPADVAVPVLLNKHDLTCVLFERFSSIVRNPIKRIYALTELPKVRRIEREACRSCDVVLAASPVDCGHVSAMAPQTPVVIVPNAVDLTTYSRSDQPASPQVDLLFFGAMDFYPNQDAVQFLVSEILPRIRRRVPSVTLLVAGRNLPGRLADQLSQSPAVRCMTDVPNMSDVIASASVCVVPLRIGSGTRLKILEAAALKKAVISTSIGAEGLDFTHGKDILIADSAEQFASASVSLLSDTAYRRSIGEAARERVESSFSLQTLRASLAEALDLAANAQRQRLSTSDRFVGSSDSLMRVS